MLGIKWSTEFRLLGLHFDQCLTKMDQNCRDCFEKVKKELNLWRHRFLTIFGKITVIKGGHHHNYDLGSKLSECNPD